MNHTTLDPTFYRIRSCLSLAVLSIGALLVLMAAYIDWRDRDIRNTDAADAPALVVLPTVTPSPAPTPTPLPTATPDPDAVYFAALQAWASDAMAWVDRWEPLLDLSPGSAAWTEGWAQVARDGNTLAGRLHSLPVHAGRTNMQGLATETFGACVISANAFRDGEIAGARLNMSLCATGFTLLADKIRRER